MITEFDLVNPQKNFHFHLQSKLTSITRSSIMRISYLNSRHMLHLCTTTSNSRTHDDPSWWSWSHHRKAIQLSSDRQQPRKSPTRSRFQLLSLTIFLSQSDGSTAVWLTPIRVTQKKNCRAHAVVLSTQKSKKKNRRNLLLHDDDRLSHSSEQSFFLQQHENSLTHEKLRPAGGVGSALSSAQRRKKRKT